MLVELKASPATTAICTYMNMHLGRLTPQVASVLHQSHCDVFGGLWKVWRHHRCHCRHQCPAVGLTAVWLEKLWCFLQSSLMAGSAHRSLVRVQVLQPGSAPCVRGDQHTTKDCMQLAETCSCLMKGCGTPCIFCIHSCPSNEQDLQR